MGSLGLERKKYISSRGDAGRFNSTQLLPFVLGILLVLATLAVYYPVHGHDFVNYDDPLFITDNIHVKYGLDWDGVKWAFTTFYFKVWVPLSWLSHALDCQMFGLNPGGHHDTNLLLHVLSVVLLFRVLLKATGYKGRSFMVAALFALHPINVESVAWVAERRNTLSMVFFLLALGAYRWYASEPKAGRYLVVAMLFVLGLLSKPQVITFPCVLLLWDYWPLGRMFASHQESSPATTLVPARSFSWLLVEKLPLLAMAAADAVVTMKASEINRSVSLSLRLANAPVSYTRYLGKAFWPSRLANLYPLLGNSLRPWHVLSAVLFLLAVTILVAAARQRRYLLVGWLWFLGTAVPMIGLVQVGRHAMADRYAYLPFIGLFIMICWGVADWYGRLRTEQRPLSGRGMAGVSVAVLLALGVTAHRQVGYWRNSETLWTHTLQVTSGNYQAEDNLGSALMVRGQYEMALGHLRKAETIYPSYPLTPYHIGLCEQQLGNLPAAVEQYRKVIDLTESDVVAYAKVRHDAFQNISVAYHDLGDSANAWQSREAANDLQRRYTW